MVLLDIAFLELETIQKLLVVGMSMDIALMLLVDKAVLLETMGLSGFYIVVWPLAVRQVVVRMDMVALAVGAVVRPLGGCPVFILEYNEL